MNGSQYTAYVPVRIQWKDESGEDITEDGLTENIGLRDALVYLPRRLPGVGSKVVLTVTDNAQNEVEVSALVLRLDRNPAHPLVSLKVTAGRRVWKTNVWEAFKLIVDEDEEDED
jgi:hypothetical protein